MMEGRLTVTDFYQTPNIDCAIEIHNLHTAFFRQEWLFVTTKDAPVLLQQFSLKSRKKEKEILLPHEGLAGVATLGDLTCVYFSGMEDLFVCSGQKVMSLKSHFIPITCLTAHKGNIYTGSADMTLRVWNPKKDTLIQDPKLHALSAHTGSVNLLQSLQDFLVSSSADRSVIVWRGTQIHAKRSLETEVIMIQECLQSRQLAFCQQSGRISIIDAYLMAKQRRIEIIRKIDETLTHSLIGLHQVDDSFLQIILPSQLRVADINLGNVIAKVTLGKLELLASKCLRRMTLLAVSMKGLYTLTF